jgi:hypothetical protein
VGGELLGGYIRPNEPWHLGHADGTARQDERVSFRADVPYDELDPPVVELVRALNEGFVGVATIGSCGGHADGKPGEIHAPADEWWVTFELEPANPDPEATTAPSDAAWLDLEFLAYWIGQMRAQKGSVVHVEPYAPPPHLNFPGRMLRFEMVGYRSDDGGVEPDDVAAWFRQGLGELHYRSASSG